VNRIPAPRLLLVLRVLVVALGVAASADVARAAGFYLPGRGLRAAGRAGAFVASCDDPQCLWYNPANLAALDGYHLLVDAAAVFTTSTFRRATRQEDGRDIAYGKVSNGAPPVVSPSILFAGDFGLEDFGFGAGVFAPYGPHLRYPEGGPQRYSLVNTDGTLALFMGLAAAWQPHPQLRVGLGFQNMLVKVSSTMVGSAYTGLFGRPEDRDQDLLMQGIATGAFNPTGNAGLWWRPTQDWGLELAFSLQLPVDFSERGKVRVRLPSGYYYDNVTLDPEIPPARITAHFPLVARWGVRWAEARWDAEASVTFERWSPLKRVTIAAQNAWIRDAPGLGDSQIRPLHIVTEMRDSVGFQLGGKFMVLPTLEVRAGYGFEMSAFDARTYSVFLPDGDKHTLALGASYRLGRTVTIDFSYAHIFNQPRNIGSSTLRQQNPVDDDLGIIVGNGRYRGGFDIVGLGLRFAFGRAAATLDVAPPPDELPPLPDDPRL
jgi:long-chain fatty acid transport protein